MNKIIFFSNLLENFQAQLKNKLHSNRYTIILAPHVFLHHIFEHSFLHIIRKSYNDIIHLMDPFVISYSCMEIKAKMHLQKLLICVYAIHSSKVKMVYSYSKTSGNNFSI